MEYVRDRVREDLLKIQNRVFRSAPAYIDRMKRANDAISQFEKLQNEECRLKDEIAIEENFKRLKGRELHEIDRMCKMSAAGLEAQKESLRAAVLQNAALCIARQAIPEVALFDRLKGKTPVIEWSRKQAKIIELKASLMRKMDRVRELRRVIFCLDGYEAFSDVKSGEQELFELLGENGNAAPVSADEYAIGVLGQIFEKQVGEVRMAAEEVTMPRLHYAPVQSFGVEAFRFKDLGPLFDEKEKSEKKERIAVTWADVRDLIRKVREDMTRRAEEYKRFCGNRYVFCSDLIYKVQDQISLAQTTLASLSKSLVSSSPEIWADEYRVISAMYELVLLLKRFAERMAKERAMTKFGDFDPIEVHEVTVDVVSATQIDRCLELVSSLEDDFARDLNLQEKIFHQIKDLPKVFQQVNETLKTDDIFLDLPEPVLLDDSEDRALFEELQKEVHERQAAQLKELQEALEGLPESLKELEIPYEVLMNEEITHQTANVETPVLDKKEVPTLNVDATPSLCAMIAESNMFLLEKIKNKRFVQGRAEISAPEELAIKDDIGQQTISNAVEKLMDAVDTDSLQELNAKRNSLIEKLASARMTMADSETKKIAKWQREQDRLKQKMDLVAERDALLTTSQGVKQLEQAKSAEQKYLASLEKLRNKQQLLQSQLTEKNRKRERLMECESELQQVEKDMESLNREIQEKDNESLSREASVSQ